MKKAKILLVEDDKILSSVLYEELKEADFQVFQAFDGEVGLKLANSKKPDLILLDVLMPKLDGFSALASLKKSPATKDIPVIMLTMLGSDEDLKKGLKLGATDYIVKSQHAVGEIIEKIKSFFEQEAHPEAKQVGI